jgi:hypothetical protein
MSNSPLVQTRKFDSHIDKNWKVKHTYKLIPGLIKNSHGVDVLKSLWILKDIL